MLKIGALVAFTLVIGARALPRLLGYVAKTRSRELFTLTVLVLALGIAVGSAKLFGESMALGAFLAGMVVGQSDFSSRAASEALPMRDAFAVLFFVSVGMMFDPFRLKDAADAPATDAAVQAAKELKPDIFVMAQATYASQLPTLSTRPPSSSTRRTSVRASSSPRPLSRALDKPTPRTKRFIASGRIARSR